MDFPAVTLCPRKLQEKNLFLKLMNEIDLPRDFPDTMDEILRSFTMEAVFARRHRAVGAEHSVLLSSFMDQAAITITSEKSSSLPAPEK